MLVFSMGISLCAGDSVLACQLGRVKYSALPNVK